MGNSNSANLYFAARNGNIKTVKKLLKEVVHLDSQEDHKIHGYFCNEDCDTALMAASKNNHMQIVQILTDKGAKLDLQNKDGKTALILASVYGYTQLAKLIINKGANLDMQTKYGKTALIYASQYGHTKIVQMLIKDANLDLQDNKGKSACYYSLVNKHDKITKMLMDKGYYFPEEMIDYEFTTHMNQYKQREAEVMAMKEKLCQPNSSTAYTAPPAYTAVPTSTEKQPVDV